MKVILYILNGLRWMNVISVRGDIWVMTGFKMYLSVNFFLNQRRHANETVNSNQVELG